MTLKKIAIAVFLTFALTIAYQVLAAYMINPNTGLDYPNPGHYPGQIGPGTFNNTSNSNAFWKFPGDVNVSRNLTVENNLIVKNSSGSLESMLSGGIIKEKFLPYCKQEITSDVYSNGENQQTGCNFGGYNGYYNISNLKPENVKEGVEFGRGQVGTLEQELCTCSGISYETKTINGDTIYVDCYNDRCWSPTANSTYAWSSSMLGSSAGEPYYGECSYECPNCSGYEACNYCANQLGGDGCYAGFCDWHLPRKEILKTLCGSPSCSGATGKCFGGEGSCCDYWTSTETNDDEAYYIGFFSCGEAKIRPKTRHLYVRCVHS